MIESQRRAQVRSQHAMNPMRQWHSCVVVSQERLDNRNYVTEDDQRLRDAEDRLKQALDGSLSELSSTRPPSPGSHMSYHYDNLTKADQGPFDDHDELCRRIDDYKKCGGTRLLRFAEELHDALQQECRAIYEQYHD